MSEAGCEPTPSLQRGSRGRLTDHTRPAFAGDTLHDAIGRVLCDVGTVPRKEFFEAWAVAKRVRRRFTGGPVVELCAGHGLLAPILLLLDPTSTGAVCVDRRRPKNADRLHEALAAAWPRLREQVRFVEGDLTAEPIPEGALVASVHACGRLTDRVLDRAIEARARVAVLPCCHSLKACDTGGLTGWLPGPLAVDAVRALRLRAAGYRVHTQTIPADITPKNRLLLGTPGAAGAD